MGQTRVVRWEGDEERLVIFPGTDVLDLAYRFTAGWVHNRFAVAPPSKPSDS